MADTKYPLRHLIDVAVYAPIGLILLARRELPNLVATGRTRVDNQVTLARFVGKLAVKRGRQELQRRLDSAEAARNRPSPAIEATSFEIATIRALDGPADQVPPTATAARTLPEVIITAVAAAPAPNDDPTLPIDGYDSLAASQVVVRLRTLTAAELEVIRDHEQSHRARRTILGKINQLQAR